MIADVVRRHPLAAAGIAFALGVVVVVVIWAIASAATRGGETPGASGPVGPSASATPYSPSPVPTGSSATPEPSGTATGPGGTPSYSADCSAATTTVTTADELEKALDAAQPGETIALADGLYSGEFTASVSGAKGDPITLCGSSAAVLDAGSTDKGYVFHLDHAQYWHLVGFTVQNGQKGVMADGTVGSVIEGLTVHTIGDEAIHLRDFSTDNVVKDNTVSDTGHRRDKFGEGIYIGTANSNWSDITGGAVDKSDRNVIEGNRISDTTAESVDIKEGTSDGILRDNVFDGAGMTDGDSWVDVKGNGWLIEGNHGAHSQNDGFQTHSVYDGWGTDNTFRDNVADVDGPGFGYSLTPVDGNVVDCSNRATGAKEGLSNVTCRS